MAIDFSFIDHDILGDVADAIRFVEGSTAGIAPADYPQRIRALDKYIPDYDVLNFTMPNGGTISLNKIGSPTVVELEYWLNDNGRWIVWQPDNNGNRSLTLNAGQRMYVRNTSETSTLFSTGGNNYYRFILSAITEAHGKISSLLCKNVNNASISASCFRGLFYLCNNLITAPEIPFTETANACYRAMFSGCSNLPEAPILYANKIEAEAYSGIFADCVSVNKIYTYMTDITAYNCINIWLTNTFPIGDFYCPAELTIPTGASGIPSGWTRHDLT